MRGTYLAIVKVRLGDAFGYALDAAPEAEAIRMPPMMLLPVLDLALAHGTPASDAARTLRLRVTRGAPSVRIDIDDSGAAPVAGSGAQAVADIRERLRALYGAAAGLACTQGACGNMRAAIELSAELDN